MIKEINENLLAGKQNSQPSDQPSDGQNQYVSPPMNFEESKSLQASQKSAQSQSHPPDELELAQMTSSVSQLPSQPSQDNSKRANSLLTKFKSQAKIKFQQTFMDHVLIIMYNMIEPVLVGLSLSVCLQLPMVTGLSYIAITLLGILPFLLSGKRTQIKCKRYLAIFMALIAAAAIGLKGYYYYEIDLKKPTDPDILDLYHFFGVWENQGFKTFAVDSAQLVICILYVFHYQNQLQQAIKRDTMLAKQDYQTEVKLLHPLFGRKHSAVYVVAMVLYLSDSLVLLTYIQLAILFFVLFAILRLYFSVGHFQSKDSRKVMLRTMQVLLSLQLIAIYVLQLPLAFEKFRSNHRQLLMNFGIFGLETRTESTDIGQVRAHLVLASLALTITSMYMVSIDVLKHAPEKTLMEDRPLVSDLLRMNTSQIGGRRTGGGKLEKTGRTGSYKLKLGDTSFSKSVEEPSPAIYDKLAVIWKSIESLVIRWICRVLAFVWVYLYHDWESTIILLWLLHSTVYRNNATFRKFILYFYLPYYILVFLWYYTINIEGLINWTDPAVIIANPVEWYTYGFFQFQIPPIESAFMFLNVYFLIQLVVCTEFEMEDNVSVKELMNRISHLKTPTAYQVMFLVLVYIEFPLMLTLIVAGLDKMDLYHIVLLIFFVTYTLYADRIPNFPLYLLIYANFWIIEKYIYSLCMYPQDILTAPPAWMTIVGFSTEYNPNETNEYWRYPPRFDQWVLVVLSFCLYRRSAIIGSDKAKITVQEKKSKAILAIKYPMLYRISIEIDIFWHYAMVMFAFTGFLILITLQQRTIINACNQLIVLVLICIYYARGLESLISKWGVLIASTSLSLLLIIVYQFMQQTGIFQHIKKEHPFWKNLPQVYYDWQRWFGFYKLDIHNEWFFLPYILLFAFSATFYKKFKEKLEFEKKEIIFEEEEITLLTETVDNETEENKSFRVNQSEYSSQLQNSHRARPEDPQQARIAAQNEQKRLLMAEYKHLKQFLEMRYKLPYLFYRLKFVWPVLDICASYFHLILSTVILCYALYNSLSLIWGVLLLIFMIQTVMAAKVHNQYRLKQQLRFEEQVKMNNQAEGFESQVAIVGQTSRINKTQSVSSEDRDGLDAKSANSGQSEESKIVRVKVTDEEAIAEYKSFYNSIERVTVKNRYYFWVTQYVMIAVSITLIYCFSFVEFWRNTYNSDPIFTSYVSNEIIFAAFLAGCYTDVSTNNYFQESSPFYVILVLLVFEKLAQCWLLDKFGLDEEIQRKFERMIEIHQNYKKNKTARKQMQLRLAQLEGVDRASLILGPSHKYGEGLTPIIEENESIRDSVPPGQSSQPGEKVVLVHSDIISDREAFMAFDREEDRASQRKMTIDFSSPKPKSAEEESQPQDIDSPIVELSKKKEQLLEKIQAKFEIKSKISVLLALKTVLEDIIILLVWVSCIYKENVLSLVLFIVLTFFTFARTGLSVLVVRYTVVIIFVMEYFMAVSCLSSYNSPQSFPTSLLRNSTLNATANYTVYPNEEYFYFYIPVYFGYKEIAQAQAPTINYTVNLDVTTYFGFAADADRLNGMWIDYSVILTILFYFNFCNFWMLFQPTQIVRSQNTRSEINEYIEYEHQLQQNNSDRKRKLTYQQCLSDFEQQFGSVRQTAAIQNFIFTYYHLFMIAFLLAVSIFNGSLFSFGYFLACMILISDQKNLLVEYESRTRMQKLLKYYLLPYLLLDIGLNLVYQIPLPFFNQNAQWAGVIGFQQIWTITATATQNASLDLGQPGAVTEKNNYMTSYMMKGLTFFFISTMLQILNSPEFREFQRASISRLKSNQNRIGLGLAYRFNNFKCHQLLKQAQEVEQISRMLAHVKKLIKKRDKLYNVGGRNGVDFQARKKRLQSSTPIVEDFQEDKLSDKSDGEFSLAKFEKEEQQALKALYEQRLNKLPLCHKFYLYLRRNFVSDIFFRYSEEHLDDIVEQLYLGRTSIKSKLEIGNLYQARQDYLQAQEEERRLKGGIAKHTELKEDEDDLPIKRALSEQIETRTAKFTPGSEEEMKEPLKLVIEEEQPSSAVMTDEQLAIMQQKKRLMQQSQKPWEKVDMDTNMTYKRMIGRYFVAFYKMVVSHSEYFCYFWMLFATLTNGGTLYLVYPVMIFGYALLLEERPGKWFWFVVLTYTQIIIVANFTLMLNLWKVLLPAPAYQDSTFQTNSLKANIVKFFDQTNLGFKDVQLNAGWWESFKEFLPEILIIVSVMILIMQQTLSGVLGVPFREFESFEKGLLRYKLNISKNEQEKEQILLELTEQTAIHISLDKNEINKYRRRTERRYSDVDKFQYSVKAFGYELIPKLEVKEEMKQQTTDDFVAVIIGKPVQEIEKRSLSVDEIRNPDYRPRKDQNLLQKASGGFFNVMSRVFWDNSFFERIFPIIKQQKPGQDLYVWQFLAQFIICIFILICFTGMTQQKSSIAAQFYSNSLSGGMVLTLLVMIFIMIVDRIIYSTSVFKSKTTQQNGDDRQPPPITELHTPIDTSPMISDSALSHRRESVDSGNQLDIYSGNVPKKASWFDAQLALSDESDEQEASKDFKDALICQKQPKRAGRTIRIYFYWALLILVHWFTFIKLPSTIYNCIQTPQPGLNGSYSYYLIDGKVNRDYVCNTFTSNGYLQTFYVLWIIYFTIAGYQMQVGLPELRKGSFMVDQFDLVSCYTFRAYLAIPFIFELRTIVDWTFTTTALDVFQTMKLAQIQANFYVNKCINAGYFTKPLGQKIGWFFKVVQGFLLMLFVLVLLVGPILLFSQINPIGQTNLMQNGVLKFTMTLTNVTNVTNETSVSVTEVPLFSTAQLSQIVQMSQTTWDTIGFQNTSYASNIGQFSPQQTQIVQFSENSDTVWTISPPLKNQLLSTLQAFLNNPNDTDVTITANFLYSFVRQDTSIALGNYTQTFNPNKAADQQVIQSLVNQVSCTRGSTPPGDPLVTQFPQLIDINQRADQTYALTPLQTNIDIYTTGFNLNYYCNDTLVPNDPNSYWALSQQWFANEDDTVNLNSTELYINTTVFPGDGFGFFVFSQQTLPSYLSKYSASILVFYISVVYVVSYYFRSAFVPMTWEIFIWDAPFNDDILMICQSINIYRVQLQLEKEEELYMILIDIMRSPEMIKSICGSSLKKKLQ